MSIYTNPASGASEIAEAYIAAVLELVGDREPTAILEETPTWCSEVAAGLDEHQRTAPEAEGKWSVAGVLQHLADSELVWGYRLRKVLAEDRPMLEGYDQDLWADRLGYATADLSEALATFQALRRANLALVRSASETDLDRVAVHNERGDESVRHMVRLYAGHDVLHRRQIERIVRTLAGVPES